ncbi:MAG TPA: UPF0182 family protein, partial [Actinomycetales bacterium]
AQLGGTDPVARYRQSIDPLRRPIIIVVALLTFVFAGSAAAGRWRTYLLWRNGTDFGIDDPQFNLDVSFFVFTMPFLRFVLSLLVACVVLSLIAAFVTHYLYGGLRLQGGGDRTTQAARVHLAVLLGLFLLLRGASYWLDRYSLTTAEHSLASGFTGMTYTDANAVLSAKLLLAIAAVIVGALFIASIWTQSWRLPVIGVALLLVCAVAVGGLYPAAVQRFRVKPSEETLEQPFIDRNIKATRAAYGLDKTKVDNYDAQTVAAPGQLRDDAETVPGIRLLDPALVSDAFRQLEQVRQYYAFPNSLDVDRYQIDGESRDTVIAVRELQLNGIAAGQRNWVNDHTYYTHGYGLVAAYGNQRTSDGKPVFYEGDIPPTEQLGKYEPRIYFGEQSPDYSIVGAPPGTRPFEFDYPSGERNNQTTYNGDGGVALSSFARRAAYSLTFQDQNLLLSNRVNSASRILYDRHPRDRVRKAAPWLTLDGDPYPAVVDGRVKWIVDGYTTADGYPNSQRTTLDQATADSITTQQNSAVATLAPERVNYVRNSVKATVDAFDGAVDLYEWDQSDPVLKTWMKAFPGTVKPLSQISAQLMSHLRYPEDLFKVQRTLFAKYHVTDPGAFYGGDDFWRVPDDPTRSGSTVQPPYYLTLQMPGASEPNYSLTSTFIPTGTGTRNVLTAFAAVNSNAGSTAGVKSPTYGEIRVLQLPKDSVVSGPGQVQNNFNANPTVSQSLNLLRQGSSGVENGNLLTLPVGGGLLYVQPVYVRGAGTTSYPLLQKVLVSFGDKIGFADTLDEALDQVFGGNSGAETPDGEAGGGGDGEQPGTPAPPTTTPQEQLRQALADAQAAIEAGQAALARQDFAAYGAAQNRLQAALQRAVAADTAVNGGAAPAPSATAGASAAPTPGPTGTATTPAATPAPGVTLSQATPVPTATGAG